MKNLGLQIEPWILYRHVCAKVDTGKHTLTIEANELDSTPASIFPGIIINEEKMDREPFVYVLTQKIFLTFADI